MKTKGVLDADFRKVPAEVDGKTPVAYGYWCTEWSLDPALGQLDGLRRTASALPVTEADRVSR
ncbi:hypothetical protein [Austwickia chelonae]|uniref:hypothetical protein n=1 Tax=Austwickia chelonae TaxID=100225 RepID=UPI0019678889|nr:hypothetical protein [Austwickia chelonae]